MIGMVVAAVRFEGNNDLRLDAGNHAANSGLDVEHVDVGERMRIVAPESFLARRVVKSQEHRFFDPETLARKSKLLNTHCPEVVNRSHRRMRLPGFAVGCADQRHAGSAFGKMRQHASMEDLIVGMGLDEQKRRSTAAGHGFLLYSTRMHLMATGLTGPF